MRELSAVSIRQHHLAESDLTAKRDTPLIYLGNDAVEVIIFVKPQPYCGRFYVWISFPVNSFGKKDLDIWESSIEMTGWERPGVVSQVIVWVISFPIMAENTNA
jgi:hypothetical protein